MAESSTEQVEPAAEPPRIEVVGGTLSGKSTALRTLVCGLALTHTPAEVQVYCLDFGGGSLGSIRDLPHVGGVAGRLDGVAGCWSSSGSCSLNRSESSRPASTTSGA